MVVFGPTAPGEEVGSLELTTTVPVRLRGVQVSSEALEVGQVAEAAVCRHHVLLVRIREEAASGEHMGRITVDLETVSEEGEAYREEHEVRFFGTVQGISTTR